MQWNGRRLCMTYMLQLHLETSSCYQICSYSLYSTTKIYTYKHSFNSHVPGEPGSAISPWFLQRGSIACYAECCTSHRILSVWPSDRPCVTVWHCVKMTQARIMRSSLEDSPMTLVSSCLTAARNSKGNLGSEAAEWERGGKSRQFLANKSPYLGNGAR